MTREVGATKRENGETFEWDGQRWRRRIGGVLEATKDEIDAETLVWVVTDGARNLYGWWTTKAAATQKGYLKRYLLSGVDVIKVPVGEAVGKCLDKSR